MLGPRAAIGLGAVAIAACTTILGNDFEIVDSGAGGVVTGGAAGDAGEGGHGAAGNAGGTGGQGGTPTTYSCVPDAGTVIVAENAIFAGDPDPASLHAHADMPNSRAYVGMRATRVGELAVAAVRVDSDGEVGPLASYVIPSSQAGNVRSAHPRVSRVEGTDLAVYAFAQAGYFTESDQFARTISCAPDRSGP